MFFPLFQIYPNNNLSVCSGVYRCIHDTGLKIRRRDNFQNFIVIGILDFSVGCPPPTSLAVASAISRYADVRGSNALKKST